MIYIFCSHIDSDWSESDEEMLKYVSLKRRDKIAKLKSLSQKKLTLYSALLVRMQLGKLSGVPNSMLNFETTSKGKPICKNFDNLFFSFSHTNGFILLAISDTEIGADVELIREISLNVAKRVCVKEELTYINSSINKWKVYHNFFNIWTKKEAYIKYLGTGLSFDLRKINVLSEGEINNFRTWKESYDTKQYVCSIYSKNIGVTDIIPVTPTEIANYFMTEWHSL